MDRSLFTVETVPGSPGEASFADGDPRLVDVSTPATNAGALPVGERMFVSVFGMKRQTYRQQPGLRVCESPCTAADVNALLAANPDRVIWVDGDLTVDASIGSTTAPAMLIVDGDTLTLDPGVEVTGFVYLTGGASTTSTIALSSGQTFIRGALVAEGDLVTANGGTAELTVEYRRDVLNLLRDRYGSWVRVGGGWRDFRTAP